MGHVKFPYVPLRGNRGATDVIRLSRSLGAFLLCSRLPRRLGRRSEDTDQVEVLSRGGYPRALYKERHCGEAEANSKATPTNEKPTRLDAHSFSFFLSRFFLFSLSFLLTLSLLSVPALGILMRNNPIIQHTTSKTATRNEG